MALLADERSRLIAYLQAQNPLISAARDSYAWDFAQAYGAATADAKNMDEATQVQSQLGTATGDQLTALCADRGVYRLPPTAATGPVIFTRSPADPNNSFTVYAGYEVQTTPQPGVPAQRYQLTAPATIPANQTQSNTVYATAELPGIAGNANTGLVNVPTQALVPGLSVSNTAPMAGGADQEADAALLIRTLEAIAPSTTVYYIQAAAQGVPGIFSATVYDWQDFQGNYTVYACDASGNLSSSLNGLVTAAVAAIDGPGLTRHVQDYQLVTQNVATTITVDTANYVVATVLAAVQNAIAAYVGALLPGKPLRIYDLLRAIDGSATASGGGGGAGAAPQSGVPGVLNARVTTPAADVTATQFQIIRLGTNVATQG